MTTGAFTLRGKLDFFNGVHQPTDTYKMALYGPDALLSKLTESYSIENEIVGQGYVAGGKILTDRVVAVANDADTVYMDFSDVLWPVSTLAGVSGAIVYNSSKAGNPAIGVIDFGQTYSSTNGPFKVQLPPPGVTSLFRIK